MSEGELDNVEYKEHGVPGVVTTHVECGDGYSYDIIVNVDHMNLSDVNLTIEEYEEGADEPERIMLTPETWLVLREAVDAALRLNEIAREALKDDRINRRSMMEHSKEKPPTEAGG
jgi:hypothetical protein